MGKGKMAKDRCNKPNCPLCVRNDERVSITDLLNKQRERSRAATRERSRR